MAYSGSLEANLSNYDEALKEFYLPAIQDQLNRGTILSDLIDTNEEDVSGKAATIECHYGRSSGVGVRPDGAYTLPDAAYQKFKKATVPMRYNYGRVAFTGPTIAATRDERGSYARVVDTEVRGITDDVMREVNRQLWGTGYGTVGKWRSGTTTTITLQKRYLGNSAGGDGFGSTFGSKYVKDINNLVSAVPNSSTSTMTTVTIGTTQGYSASTWSVSTSTSYDTITTADLSADSLAAGSYFVRKGSSVTYSTTASSGRKEMMGLRGIVTDTDVDDAQLSDGTSTGLVTADPLQTLDVSTYPWWKANVMAHASGRYAGQRALSLKLLQQMFDKVELEAGKDYGPDLIITTQAIRREYLDIMQTDRRNVNTMTLDGGWEALDYNGVPMLVDEFDAIDGEVYFLTTKDLAVFRMSDYDWMTKDGAVLSRVANYDAYEAVLFRYAEMGCRRRNSHGVLADLNYTAT